MGTPSPINHQITRSPNHQIRYTRPLTGTFFSARRERSNMAADFFLGESLVGDGNEVAHIDLIIGSKTGPAGTAFCNALANNKDGFTTLLAVVAPNLAAKPDTLL